jgi:Family of unknown function (DUF6519)
VKADRSRDTFDPKKHYRRVLHQQGRVVLDADDNEQVSIDLATSETTISDVIGPAGVPETSLSSGYTGGFAIGIGNRPDAGSSSSSSSAQSGISSASGSSSSSNSSLFATGNDLTIAHGRIYVDGVLVVNDQDTTLLTQPFLPLDAGDLAATGLSGAGVYGAYLDVWERVITPIDDPAIQEVALGGPDTSLRTQIAWQVRLGQIDTSEFGENPACSEILPPWPQTFNQGLLTAGLGAPSADPIPCSLPPQSGYRSLENQLYRVEIHSPGGYGAATFKWSRENASVVFGIVAAPGQSPTGTVTGKTLYVTTTGRDASLGVKHNDWVELIDDRSELLRGAGELLQVDTSDPGQMTITLLTAPSQPIDLSRHPKLRRWDQSQNAGAGGILIADGTPIDLENGIQAQFSNGQYAVGDYWLIPARTATTQETVGTIEWPRDAAGNFVPQPPRGVVHHYCKLAIVAFDGANFQPPQGSAAVTDCRLFFPPLTAIETQASNCTLTLQPNTNWTAQLAELFPRNTTVDAEICFATGEFDTAQPVVIDTPGNVKVTGAGWGTKLFGRGLETVLRFRNCASVVVRDLAAVATRVDGPVDAVTQHIGGSLEFDDCGAVTVENVDLSCASALSSGAACLTVRNTVTAANTATGAGAVRVSGSQFTVGEMQYGMVLVHVATAVVTGNVLNRIAAPPTAFGVAIANPGYRKLVERLLVSGSTPARAASSSASSTSSATVTADPSLRPGVVRPVLRLPNANVRVGSVAVAFNTPPQLRTVWQTYLDTAGPREFASSADLLNYLKRSAATLLANPAAQQQFSGFGDVVRWFTRNQSTIARAAIVVGGRAVTALAVEDNVIDGFLQGVVVGVSHREAAPTLPADSAGSVVIRGNRIGIVLDAVLGHAAGRYAIYVGNVGSLQIEDNRATLTAPANVEIDAEGIRVFGYLGRKMVVRHNHMTRFQTGIRVAEVTGPGSYNTIPAPSSESYLAPLREGPLWLIADNVLEFSRMPVNAPSCLQIDNTR